MSESLQAVMAAQGLDARGRLLVDVLTLWDQVGIAYSLLHGYEDFPYRIDSDVDCVVSSEMTPTQLKELFSTHRDRLQAEVVQWLSDGAWMVILRTLGADGKPHFLPLHVARQYELAKHSLYTAAEILASRRRYRGFWTPAPEIAFAALLTRRIVKGRLDPQDQRRLEALHRQAPDACPKELTKFCSVDDARFLSRAAQTGNWEQVSRELPHLRKRLLRRLRRQRPLAWTSNLMGAAARRVRKWFCRDRGLSVAFLGTDGSGKSSAAQAVAESLAPVFSGYERRTFPPGLRRKGPRGTNSTPHAAPLRSYLHSIFRALAYWLPYSTLAYPITVGRRLRRNGLVIHDRHLVDALVDPRRYRYGGPRWLLKAIWSVAPQPDLVILLDVPPEVAQARKQEVPFAETARQRDAYRALVASIPQGHVVDAAQELQDVVADVTDILLQHLEKRTARRWRKEGQV